MSGVAKMVGTMVGTDVPKPARQILGYFRVNPNAADTLEGVARWRLLEERVHQNVEATNDALAWLVAHGFLVEFSTPYTRRVFLLNPGKLAEIDRLLSRNEDSGDSGGEGEREVAAQSRGATR